MDKQKIKWLPDAPRAPFRLGEVPRSAWFCIETTYDHPEPNPAALASALGYQIPVGQDALSFAEAHGFGREIARAENLAALADAFACYDAEGRGILITRDHAGLNREADTRAAGWIKALHAEGETLWAWVEWTPWGHSMVNGGEFVHFSTEYDYRDFALVEGGATPTRLTGCTITNEPRHAAQIPCTNMQYKTMKNHTPTTPRAVNSDPEAPKTDITDEKELLAATTNSDDDEQVADTSDLDDQVSANSDDPTGLSIEGACQQIAELLNLPAACTPEDLVAAVQNLQQSNSEIAAALEEANVTANAAIGTRNSRLRFPNLTARNASRKALVGHTPTRHVPVAMGGARVAVNSQTKARVDFCNAAVAKRESELGRRLTAGEFSQVYDRANKDYSFGQNR